MKRILGYMCFIVCIGMVMVSCDWIFSLLAPQPSSQDEKSDGSGSIQHTLLLRTAAGGGGDVVDTAQTVKGLTQIDLYAARYKDGVYQEDITVDWNGSGIISGNLSVTSGSPSTSFMATTEGNGTISATHTSWGTAETPTITVDNTLQLKESLRAQNYSPFTCSRGGGDWQVNGGQSTLGGSYALAKYAWPELSGLPEGVTSATLHIHQHNSSGSGTYHYSLFPITEVDWDDSAFDGQTWGNRPTHDQGDEKAYTGWEPGGTVPRWYSIDITPYYNSWFGDPNFYGFCLYTTAPWSANTFHGVCGPGYSLRHKRPYIEVTKGGYTVRFILEDVQ